MSDLLRSSTDDADDAAPIERGVADSPGPHTMRTFPEDAAEALGPSSGRHAVADDVLKHVDPAYRRLEAIGWWITVGVIATALLVGAIVVWVNGLPGWLNILVAIGWIAITSGLALLARAWPRWEYERLWYRVSPDGIEIRKGVFWRRVINVQRSRVQHTDVLQGPIARRLGLASLIIHTAGTEHATVTLDGLTHETALAVRDLLIEGGPADGV